MSMASTNKMPGDVVGSRMSLLGLVLQTTAMTVATLGVYSFWARTRARRWIWSSLRLGNAPFEYVGRPLEKLMGFVIAAVIVALYLALVVMVLVFASLNLFRTELPGMLAAIVLIAPVFWLAKYRGLRYLMNHTRWRGISFSMDSGAGGYVLRAILWSLATVLSAGILMPFRTYQLWKYRAERIWYGDDRFEMQVSMNELYGPFIPVLIGFYGTAASIAAAVTGYWSSFFGFLVFPPVLFFAWVNWRVASFRILASGLRFGGKVRLRVEPKTLTVIGIHLLGWILQGMLLGLLVFIIGTTFGFFSAGALEQLDLEALEDVSPYVIALVALITYLGFFLLRGALKLAMITFPVIAHTLETLVVSNPLEINNIERGEKSHMADADGFANLFDMGSGI